MHLVLTRPVDDARRASDLVRRRVVRVGVGDGQHVRGHPAQGVTGAATIRVGYHSRISPSDAETRVAEPEKLHSTPFDIGSAWSDRIVPVPCRHPPATTCEINNGWKR